MTIPDIVEKLGGAPHSKQSLRLWLRLLSCSMVIEKRIRQKLSEEFDSTLPRFDVLAALDRNRAGLKMGELSDWLLVSNGNVTSIVDRLLEDGFVERLHDEGDRRILRVRLTREGKKQFARMAKAHEGWLDRLLGDLSDDDFDALLSGLHRLRLSTDRNPI